MPFPIGAVIAGVGSAIGGIASSRAARRSAKVQADAARDAADLQREQFEQTREDLSPYRDLGARGASALEAALFGSSAAAASVPQITTRTIPGGGGGRDGDGRDGGDRAAESILNLITGRRPSTRGKGAESFFNSLTGQMPSTRNGGGGGQNRTVFMVGDMEFANRDDAQAYVDSIRAQQEAGRQQGLNIFNMRPEVDANFNPAAIMARSGMPGVTVDGNQTYFDAAAGFETSPGFEFMLGENMDALTDMAAARGLRLGGPTLEAAQNRAMGLAQQDFGNYVARREANFGNNFNRNAATFTDAFNRGNMQYNNALNRLFDLTGMGQSAAAQTGQFGAASAANQGSLLSQAANAQARGIVGQNNALQGTLGNLSQIWGMNQAGYFDQPQGRASGYGGVGQQINPTNLNFLSQAAAMA